MILIEGLSHFLKNFLQNLASCQTSFEVKITIAVRQLANTLIVREFRKRIIFDSY
jgi:hypothetical protein